MKRKNLFTLGKATAGLLALGMLASCVYSPYPASSGYYYSSPSYYNSYRCNPYGYCYYGTSQYYYYRTSNYPYSYNRSYYYNRSYPYSYGGSYGGYSPYYSNNYYAY